MDATGCVCPGLGQVSDTTQNESQPTDEQEKRVYAVVRSGGKQHKVAVGDVLEVEKLEGEPGASVTLPALLLVDGGSVTSDAQALAGVTVTAEVLGATKGPKISMIHYRNKTGYKRRLGHRQQLTRLKVTGIESGKD